MAQITQTRMTAAEFSKLPETNLPCELINGEVIIAPAPTDWHQIYVHEFSKVLERMGPDGRMRISPNDVYLDDENIVQPDVFWIRREEARCKRGEDGHWYGPPDLVVEIISPGSIYHDKVNKFRLYERHGVSEYWIVEPRAHWVEVWVLEGGRYHHHGIFGPEESFTSPALGGKTVLLAEVFANED